MDQRFLRKLKNDRRMEAGHIAVLTKDGKAQTEGMANWIGTREGYLLKEEEGATALTILMHYHPDYEQMLDEGWGVSLQ